MTATTLDEMSISTIVVVLGGGRSGPRILGMADVTVVDGVVRPVMLVEVQL
jgi:hypothetical protein